MDGTDTHGPYDLTSGHFFFLHAKPDTENFFETDASLVGPSYQNSMASCIFEFYIYLDGDIGKIVYTLNIQTNYIISWVLIS